ncbi:hypothetical protein DSCA_23040 [Desulfosarcina alkanivorans]|uniref:Uncharacterized protein n=1 Tax=Desulfosarcina alkanivorans TaxID=571177 RepID=A0A5K7YPY8_9BACT|nr:DNRLRE domain-containing protein [Desulfosarcina alkanivorans]BBO68374.1 hypothetical protein DSCA_23040 [Desulfosarcina alkanivorans]
MRRYQLIVLFSIFYLLIFSLTAHAGVVDIGSSEDAQVVEASPTSNYGTSNNLYVASADGGSYLNERAWVKFDISSQVPPGAVINSAKLRLYCFKADDADDMVAAVHGSTDDTWTETGITWDNQPGFDATALGQTTMTAGQTYYWVEWDVTAFVRTEFTTNGDFVVSFVVKPATEGQDPWRTCAFDAREYGAALAPRLRIDYTGDWPTDGAFKIFHMNDMHSRLLPHEFDVPEVDDVPGMEMVGGASCFATKMLELKTANPDSLIMDAGDISEGNPLGDLRGNGGMIDFYNLLDSKLKALGGRGIDAVVVGNHDVNSALMLNNMKNKANFPAISMNIYDAVNGTPYFPEFVTVTVNGTKVGILGYTTDSSSFLGDDLVGVVEVRKCVWEDEDNDTINIKDMVNELRTTEGCDVVILLSHVGQSRVTAGEDALIADSGGVLPPEVVISGHWHTWTERVWQPSNMNGKTLVAEAASYMQYIGELEVTGSGKYVQAQKHVIRNSDILPDADMENLIAGLITEYNNQSPAPPHGIHDVIGYSAVDLTLDKDKWWTVSEYPWAATNAAGAWICDAMVWKAGQLGYPVDLALQSGGGIRRDVAAGEITYIEIYEAYPWSDDNMVRVQMTGQEIWDWIQSDYVGTSISAGWHVTAHDGQITAITYQENPINMTGTYEVAISEYMFVNPENPLSGTTSEDMDYSIREGVVDFTAQYNTPENPMYADGIAPRYDLNTEFAGGFRAVVTMVADSESQPYFEDAFIRLIEATPATLARRTGYGLSELVRSDGAIDLGHRFSEIMLYRSHLGLTDGLLKTGDVIEVWGEGGFFDGTPEFIDQEGISEAGDTITILNRDEALARPEYHAAIASFWDEDHENHYVKFYAEKTGDTTVQDSAGQALTVYKEGAYYTKTLPGTVGDILELTGINTYEGDKGRRFRCNNAVVASTVPVIGYPATSAVDAVEPYNQSGASIILTATAGDYQAGPPISGTTISQTGFEEPTAGSSGVKYVATNTSPGILSNNGGDQPTVSYNGASELGFETYYNGIEGPTTASEDNGDYIGVVNYYNRTGSGSFEIEDADPEVELRLSPVDLTGYNSVQVSAFLKILGGAYESGDAVRLWADTDVGEFDLFSMAGDDLDTYHASNGYNYVQYSAMLPDTATTCQLKLTVTSDGGSEGAQLDDVLFLGDTTGGSGNTIDPVSVEFFYRHAADGLAWGAWTTIGTDTNPADGWSLGFSYPDGQGYYEFYSVSTDADGNEEDAPIRADARVLFNNAPTAPADPDPSIANGATGVSRNPSLSVTVSDTDGTAVDVCFYGGTGGDFELIECIGGVAPDGTASVDWSGLAPGTTYDWYVVVDDGLGSDQSATWSFTTAASTAVPVPAMDATGIIAALSSLLLTGMAMMRRRHV